MPRYIDPETMNVDEMPGIWSPVQWELSEEERIQELHLQATASLLWAVDAPEAILRLLLSETAIERTLEPPTGYDPENQGEWDESLVTFGFRRSMELVKLERAVFIAGFERAFQLFMDSCCFCKDCTGTRETCEQPRMARPAPEAMAVDVYTTVRRAGFTINVRSDYDQKMDRFAFLMVH